MSTAAPALPSYASGTSDVPLLGDTIGDNLDRTVAAHGDRDALVDCAAGRAVDLPRARRRRGRASRSGCSALGIGKGDRVGHLVAELRGVDAGAVRDGEDRRDPGQHQPRLPRRTSWSTC